MKGIEIAKSFYLEYGEPMLKTEFAELFPLLAVGFVGSGSERYGFDDETSRDHDFEAGFSIFLPSEDKIDRRAEFLLERAYQKLPKEYMGVKRSLLSPVGGNRNGPVRAAEFYLQKVGRADGNLTKTEWLTLPSSTLFEATNGEVFYDGLGEFTSIRKALEIMPEDVRKKRLAGNLLLMAQAGQYNFSRCYLRGEKEAAALSASEFVKSALQVLFLLEGKYAPYYKWSFHALRAFEKEEIVNALSFVATAGIDAKADAERKYDEIEKVCSYVVEKLEAQEITKATCGDLEKHAYSVNDKIEDGEIRNLNVLACV